MNLSILKKNRLSANEQILITIIESCECLDDGYYLHYRTIKNCFRYRKTDRHLVIDIETVYGQLLWKTEDDVFDVFGKILPMYFDVTYSSYVFGNM